MNPQDLQLDADNSKVSLGLATRLLEQLMREQNPMQEEGNPMQEAPETAPEQEETPQEQDTTKEDYEAKMTEMTDKIGELEMDIELMKRAILNED